MHPAQLTCLPLPNKDERNLPWNWWCLKYLKDGKWEAQQSREVIEILEDRQWAGYVVSFYFIAMSS